MKDRINRRIKKRESFRPFAPAVLAEKASEFFEIAPDDASTYAHMLYVTAVRPEVHEQLPSVTHVNGSARVQTVAREHQPRFWALLRAFGRRTGVPVLLNTSFNVQGQPIVCTPTEALETFVDAHLDALVMGDVLVTRRESESREHDAAVSPTYATTPEM